MISIIIPTHRRKSSLLRLLQSIGRQSHPMDRLEILVVSNFHDSSLESALASIPGLPLRFLVAESAGANASRNLGIRSSRGQILQLLDDDCVLQDERFLEKVMDLHAAHPSALAIGGTYSIPSGSSPEDTAYNLISREWQLNTPVAGSASARLLGGNVSYKKALLESLGELFQPSITYGGAELEFHLRLKAKGAELLLFPELEVHHLPEIRKADLLRKARKQALTVAQFALEQADSGNPLPAYQAQRLVKAMRYSEDRAGLERICSLMEEYDRAYNIVLREGVHSVTGLRLKMLRNRKSDLVSRNDARRTPGTGAS